MLLVWHQDGHPACKQFHLSNPKTFSYADLWGTQSKPWWSLNISGETEVKCGFWTGLPAVSKTGLLGYSGSPSTGYQWLLTERNVFRMPTNCRCKIWYTWRTTCAVSIETVAPLQTSMPAERTRSLVKLLHQEIEATCKSHRNYGHLTLWTSTLSISPQDLGLHTGTGVQEANTWRGSAEAATAVWWLRTALDNDIMPGLSPR